MKLLFAAGVVALLPGCEPAQAPVRPTVSLHLRGNPGDAAVVVDDEAIGQLDYVQAHGVALPPGEHHVSVKAEGYFPWDRVVVAKTGSGPIQLEVALTPVPD